MFIYFAFVVEIQDHSHKPPLEQGSASQLSLFHRPSAVFAMQAVNGKWRRHVRCGRWQIHCWNCVWAGLRGKLWTCVCSRALLQGH